LTETPITLAVNDLGTLLRNALAGPTNQSRTFLGKIPATQAYPRIETATWLGRTDSLFYRKKCYQLFPLKYMEMRF